MNPRDTGHNAELVDGSGGCYSHTCAWGSRDYSSPLPPVAAPALAHFLGFSNCSSPLSPVAAGCSVWASCPMVTTSQHYLQWPQAALSQHPVLWVTAVHHCLHWGQAAMALLPESLQLQLTTPSSGGRLHYPCQFVSRLRDGIVY